MKAALVLFLAVALVGLSQILVKRRAADGPQVILGPGLSVEVETPVIAAEKRMVEVAGSAATAGVVGSVNRTPVDEWGVQGSIVNLAGIAVEGALVSWTPRHLAREHSIRAEVGMAEILDASLWATTGADGSFSLGASSHAETGVIWVTARGYLANWKAVGSGTEEHLRFMLEVAEEQQVLVSRAGGDSVEGARVLQGGLHGAVSGPLSDKDAAMQLFVRVAIVPEGGRLEMPAWQGRRRYRAELGELRSFDVMSIGKPVELEILETVLLNGIVRASRPGRSVEGAILYVSLLDDETGGERYAFGIGLDASGIVRNLRCPWSARGGYRFEVEGAGLVRGDISTPYAAVGSTVSFEIVCQDAGSVAFHFMTEDLEAQAMTGESVLSDLAGVSVHSGWRDPEAYSLVRPIQRVISNTNGVAYVSNFPKGVAYFSFSKKGFVTEYLEGANLFESPEDPIEIELQLSGGLRVRVTSEGEVLPRFTVYFWPEVLTIESAAANRLVAEDDGFGPLEGIPLGRLKLVAVAEGKPQSFPVFAEVASGEMRPIEVVLPVAVTGVGRVLDAESHLPVADAVIEIGVGNASKTVGARDAGQPVGLDGSFALPLFAPALTQITVRAPGYSPLPVMGDVGANGQIDYGTLYIGRVQPLTLRCHSEVPVDWTKYYGNVGGMIWSPQLPLKADGIYEAKNGQHGQSYFVLARPDGTSIRRPLTLFGDGPWTRDIYLNGNSGLVVEFRRGDGELPAYLGLMNATDVDLQNGAYVNIDVDKGLGTFSGIEAGIYSLVAYDGSGSPLAGMTVELRSGEETKATIDLEVAGFRLRLLGKDGVPIAGASFAVRDANQMPNLLCRGRATNSEGIATIPSTPLNELTIEAYFPSGGFMAPQRILRPKTNQPLDIVWDGGSGMLLDIFDGNVALEGLEIWVHEAQSGFPAATLNVPPGGRYERPNINSARFFAEPHSGWVWFQRVAFELDGKGTPVRLEFRRLGGLTVSVKNLLGNPAAGVVIGLTSDEFGGSVAGWLAEGRVTSDTGLITDAKGEVHLAGLPNGSFSWISGGLAGNVNVAPGTTSALAIQLVE